MEEIQYIKAFNCGYLMAKFKKELIAKISDSLTRPNSYTEGLKDGKVEYEIEHYCDQVQTLDNLRINKQARENESGRV